MDDIESALSEFLASRLLDPHEQKVWSNWVSPINRWSDADKARHIWVGIDPGRDEPVVFPQWVNDPIVADVYDAAYKEPTRLELWDEWVKITRYRAWREVIEMARFARRERERANLYSPESGFGMF